MRGVTGGHESFRRNHTVPRHFVSHAAREQFAHPPFDVSRNAAASCPCISIDLAAASQSISRVSPSENPTALDAARNPLELLT